MIPKGILTCRSRFVTLSSCERGKTCYHKVVPVARYNTVERKIFLNNKVLQAVKKVAVIVLGNVVLAFAVGVFVVPNGLIAGGGNGIALFVNHFTGLDMSLFLLIFNSFTLALGAFVFGKEFALTTLINTFFYPVMLSLFQRVPSLQNMTSDTLLAAIFAGLLIGAGGGIVLKMGASTGGMDVPNLILSKKTGINIGVFMYTFDTLILLAQATYSNSEQILYGILMVMISSLTVSKVMLLGKNQVQVQIMSEKNEEISTLIQKELIRGTTFLQAVTGFKQTQRPMLMTVISPRELPKVERIVQQADPTAFMVVNQVSEVRGRGFTLDKWTK